MNTVKTALSPILCLIMFSGMSLTHEKYSGNEVVKFTIRKPEAAQRGKTFQFDVNFSIEPSWYIYAPTIANTEQGMIETKVQLKLPDGIAKSGKMKLPEPILKNGYEVYEGNDIVMRQDLKIAPLLKPGVYEIKVKVTWQSCNSEICQLPVTEMIVTTIQIK